MGAVLGVLVWMLSGWLIAILVGPVAVAGIPALFADSGERQIRRLEAMEEWTRSLSGVLTVGVGLEQAILATLRSTPPAIRTEVSTLTARLRSGWPTNDALRAFADDLDDATGDQIAASLILGSTRRGAGLASVLNGLAETVADDVRIRRSIEADRAKPRSTARWITVITLGVLGLLALNGSYISPYGTPLGQLILGVLLASYLAGLMWLRSMTQGQPLPRFLGRSLEVGGHGRDGRRTPDGVALREPGSTDVTTLRLAIVCGAAAGLGLTLLVARLLPAHPDLVATLGRERTRRLTGLEADSRTHRPRSITDRLGVWVERHATGVMWARVPTRELRMLRIPVHHYFGEKALFALIGLAFPSIATALLALFGIRLPVTIPVIASLTLAAVLSFLPDYNARDNAAKARQEFVRALGAYVDLVALERHAGAGATQALDSAAAVGDSWVFERIREELARARWSGHPPWDGLADLADDLQLPELADLADIMRLSGEEGATVYASLRARSAGMRAALLSHEHAQANAADERLTFPVTLLAFVFLLLVSTPAILRILFGAAG